MAFDCPQQASKCEGVEDGEVSQCVAGPEKEKTIHESNLSFIAGRNHRRFPVKISARDTPRLHFNIYYDSVNVQHSSFTSRFFGHFSPLHIL